MVTQDCFLGLKDYHVFVTGGAGGIGAATIREFLGRISRNSSPLAHAEIIRQSMAAK